MSSDMEKKPRAVAEHADPVLGSGIMVDHFKVVRLVGRGGMGDVYLARDTKLGRRVALKVISARGIGSGRAVERFLVEARLTARFSHPHIVIVHAVGEHQGHPYLALEYLEGQTLGSRIQEEPPGLHESLRYGLAIAEALAEAHRNKVLHRDLKPGNVFIPKDGRLRVLDFGIAKEAPGGRQPPVSADGLESAGSEAWQACPPSDTMAGQSLGTPPYLAPELWAGHPNNTATDVWALGIVLFELVVGHHPYRAPSVRQLRDMVTSADPAPEVPLLQEVPQQLRDLIARCLDKQSGSRPAAAQVTEALRKMLLLGHRFLSEEKSPFRGLWAFAERHADLFFGRDAEVMGFLERTREEPVLPVVGPSGAGKSSFVQAGVIPRLREQGPWLVVRLRPGSDPFEALALALVSAYSTIGSETSITMQMPGVEPARKPDSGRSIGRPSLLGEDEKDLGTGLMESTSLLNLMLHKLAERGGCKVLLFVDQLEELYTLMSDEHLQAHFMQAICRAADDRWGPVRVIFAVRDDFLGRLAGGVEVREALGHVTVLRSPGKQGLEEILVRPAEAVGYGYEDRELVKEMVAAVRGEPASLPLLQFTARMLWDRRDRKRNLLCRSEYESMGGVAGALADHADGVLDGMSGSQVRVARQLLLRLVTEHGTRKVLSRGRVIEGLGREAEQVLGRLIDGRLLSARKSKGGTKKGGELELVHESLVHAWKRLSRWVEEIREDLAFVGEVGQAAELWAKRGRQNEEVWRGEALHEALRRAGRCGQLPGEAHDFLEAGEQREQRRVRRRRGVIGAAMVSLLLVAVASLGVSIALRSKERLAEARGKEALRQRHLADARGKEALRRRAEALWEGARADLARGELTAARAKLRSALETADSLEARALWWRLGRSQLYWKKELGAGLNAVTFSPDGKTVAIASQDQALHLLDVETQAERVLRGHTDQVFSLAYSRDGRQLASGTWGGEVRIWNLSSGKVAILTEHSNAVHGVSFSPDGQLLASASFDGTIRIWETASGATRAVLKGHQSLVWAVSFSPDGRLIASASHDKTIRIWETASGATRAVLKGHRSGVRDLDFSSDGRFLASGSTDKAIRIWEVASGTTRAVLKGHQSSVRNVAFSPDGRLLASASMDKTVRIWEIASGTTRAVLKGHQSYVRSVAFSPNGRMLASASVDRTVRIWNVKTATTRATSKGHQNAVYGVSFSPDGRLLASASHDRTVRIWEVASGATRAVLKGHRDGVRGVSFSPNGRLLASAGRDKTVRIWNVDSATTRAVLKGHKAIVTNVSFSPNERFLASASGNGTVRIWNVHSGAAQAVLRGHQAAVYSVSFSPDGRLLASASTDKTVRIWNAYSGTTKAVLRGHQTSVHGVDFSPDGRLLATAGNDKTVRIWEVAGGIGRILGRQPGQAYDLDFHPDGRRVGVPCSDGIARIWSIYTGTHLALRGHRSEVNYLRFSSDGKLTATGSDDGTVRLWETDTGRPVWRLPLLRRSGPELFTHRGWMRLDTPVGRATTGRAGWRRAVAERARVASESADGRLLCLGTHEDRLEMWDVRSDRRIGRVRLSGLKQVVAMHNGCVTMARGVARLHPRAGAVRILGSDVTAVSWDRGEILVAARGKIHMLGAGGASHGSYATGVGVTTMARVGSWLVVGFHEGGMELLPLRAGPDKPSFSFEGTPASPVVRILAGPEGTLVAGYGNGFYGLWSLSNGKLLEQGWLHGAVVHLLMQARKLYAASELGQHEVMDLGVFHIPYCELLRQVWEKVPVVWESGLPVRRAKPSGHRCTGSRRR